MTGCRGLAFAAGAVALAASGCLFAAAPAGGTDAALARLADEYFDRFYLPANPTGATQLGLHAYDGKLEDYSRAEVRRQIAALHGYARRFEAVDPAHLSEWAEGDRQLLLSNVRSTLLTLEAIRPWQNNPDSYSSGIATSAYVIMERDYAPANDRLRSLIERERRMPAALEAARGNLRNPPQIVTRIALEQLPGIIGMFSDDLPAAFSGATDPALRAEFGRVNGRVIDALRGYESWLQREVLPHSHGDFRLGERTYRAKLAYDEMVDIPLPRLLAIGRADLARNQAEFARVAHEIDPAKTTADVRAQMEADFPKPAALLGTFRGTFDGLVAFIQEHHIVTLPSERRPEVVETPPFLRATSFASMDAPGVFEPAGLEAQFNVTLPDPGWDERRTAGFMAQFSFPVISDVAVHEVYPGHYVQYLWTPALRDRVRKILQAASNYEGWAHYCEQMMLDEGFGQPGPDATAGQRRQALWLRLGQLQDALLRDARYRVAIGLHTGHMSLEQAREFFVEQGYQSREIAEQEVKRATTDPTYLYYTLGKLQILKLRTDLAAREGVTFDLQRFHDTFLQQGAPPIRIVRRALLHDDSPAL